MGAEWNVASFGTAASTKAVLDMRTGSSVLGNKFVLDWLRKTFLNYQESIKKKVMRYKLQPSM